MAPNNRFALIEDFVRHDQVISGEKFLIHTKMNYEFNYLKRDFFYRGGIWRGEEVHSLISRRKFFISKPLVIGHSDIPTRVVDGLIAKRLGI